MEVRGEVAGDLADTIQIQIALLDSARRVVGTADRLVDDDKFVGFENFEITCEARAVPARVRVTVKRF